MTGSGTTRWFGQKGANRLSQKAGRPKFDCRMEEHVKDKLFTTVSSKANQACSLQSAVLNQLRTWKLTSGVRADLLALDKIPENFFLNQDKPKRAKKNYKNDLTEFKKSL